MFKMNLQIQGLDKIQKQLQRLADTQIKEAAAKALNDVAFSIRADMKGAMEGALDKPTKYILNSVQVKKATPENLTATVEPTYMGGKGVDPQKILKAQVFGGPRRDKRSEVLLRRAGILQNGFVSVIPKDPYPGSDDGRGNIKGSFMVRLLSYVNSFGEQGFKANMKDKTRAKLHNIGRTANGYKTINGVMFFVSHGKLRGQHLAPGIWAKSGTHGSNVKPVLMFVRTAVYSRTLDFDKILRNANPQQKFETKMRYHIRKAVEGLGK